MRFFRPIQASLICIVWALYLSDPLSAGPLEERIDSLVEQGGYMVTAHGKSISQLAANTPFIPASTIKLATALTALELLGPTHRIKTEFYLRDTSILCIRGYGDPFLTSENISGIAAVLKSLGLIKVTGLILDTSYFQANLRADGSTNSENPYDAENGALAVNFNSLPFVKDDGVISSPEPQTPVLPLMKELGAHFKSGTHRINISAFSETDSTITPTRYTAELFSKLLEKQGIRVDHNYQKGVVQAGDKHMYTYYSVKSIAEMIRSCLKYSNNFIANQLFLYSGAMRFGAPATWQKGRRAITDILEKKVTPYTSQLTIIEGSGLSKNTTITPMAMIALLEAFKPYADLLTVKNDILVKSGTLTGVYSYAGYFSTKKSLDPFVILLNQQRNTREQLLDRLHQLYQNKKQKEISP